MALIVCQANQNYAIGAYLSGRTNRASLHVYSAFHAKTGGERKLYRGRTASFMVFLIAISLAVCKLCRDARLVRPLKQPYVCIHFSKLFESC